MLNVGSPPPRLTTAMATLNHTVVLFGGQGNWGPNCTPSMCVQAFDDTWTWDGTSWTEAAKDVTGPSARENHAMAGLDDTVVLFGGDDGSLMGLADTWTWDGTHWTQQNTPGPSGRVAASMATLNGTVVLFGGMARSLPLGDTWIWNGSTWAQRNVPGPAPRGAAAMATVNDKIVLFGGIGTADGGASAPPQTFSDTWTWDGTSWTQVDVSGVQPDVQGVLAGVNGGAVLDGTQLVNNATIEKTWRWDGTSWTQLLVDGPNNRVGVSGMATW
jgi:N-acetylneuraminic acid mutarotase